MKEHSRIAALVNSKYYPLLLFFVSMVFVTLFSRSTSFLYLFEGGDPSVFKQMGRAVLRGKILYVDYFDNKGCLLYFLHALGLWLGGNYALLVMQAFSLTATLIIWDKTLTLFRKNNKERILFVSFILLMLFCFYQAGDQTQEWCLPFISYPLLLFLKAYKTGNEVSLRQMFIIGFCFGIITFIQVNNACAFLGFLTWLWIQYLLKKDFCILLQSVGVFVFGWLFVAIPCILYFYLIAGSNGVYEMVYASFLSNFEYIGHQWKTKWIHIVPYFLFVFFFVLTIIVVSKKERNLLIPMIISSGLFIGTFGKLCNSFYLIALLPLCVIIISLNDKTENKKIKLALFMGLSLCLFYYAGSLTKDIIFRDKLVGNIYDNFHRCVEKIPKNELDSIYDYNLYWHGTSMMEHEKLLPCNRVLFTSLMFTLPTLWKEETSKPFIPPKWILLSPNKSYIDNDFDYISNNYEIMDSFIYDNMLLEKLKSGEKFEVLLLRRKD